MMDKMVFMKLHTFNLGGCFHVQDSARSAVCLLGPVSAMGVVLLAELWYCEQFVTSHDEFPFESDDLWSVQRKGGLVSAPVRNKKGRAGNVSTPCPPCSESSGPLLLC